MDMRSNFRRHWSLEIQFRSGWASSLQKGRIDWRSGMARARRLEKLEAEPMERSSTRGERWWHRKSKVKLRQRVITEIARSVRGKARSNRISFCYPDF